MLTGVGLYAFLYVTFAAKENGFGMFVKSILGDSVQNLEVYWKSPFGVAGTCVVAASVVMVVVSLLTKPLPDEHLERVFTPDRATT